MTNLVIFPKKYLYYEHFTTHTFLEQSGPPHPKFNLFFFFPTVLAGVFIHAVATISFPYLTRPQNEGDRGGCNWKAIFVTKGGEGFFKSPNFHDIINE